jgi:hypothetical protein
MPTWNGTFLGTFEPSVILAEKKSGQRRYVQLKLGEDQFLARLQQSKQPSFSNLVDELKAVFGLPKWGTHRLIIGSKLYLLSRLTLREDGYILEYPNIPQTNIIRTDEFKKQVQDVLVFRDLLALSSTSETSLYIRQGYPMSSCETGFKTDAVTNGKTVLSPRLLKNWFEETEPKTVLCRLLGIVWPLPHLSDVTELLINKRSEIEAVIKRVDPQLIHLSRTVSERLSTQLLG